MWKRPSDSARLVDRIRLVLWISPEWEEPLGCGFFWPQAHYLRLPVPLLARKAAWCCVHHPKSSRTRVRHSLIGNFPQHSNGRIAETRRILGCKRRMKNGAAVGWTATSSGRENYVLRWGKRLETLPFRFGHITLIKKEQGRAVCTPFMCVYYRRVEAHSCWCGLNDHSHANIGKQVRDGAFCAILKAFAKYLVLIGTKMCWGLGEFLVAAVFFFLHGSMHIIICMHA